MKIPLESLESAQYLGDGVYIGYIDNDIVLITHNGLDTENCIVLEDQVLTALLKYLNKHGKDEE